MGNCCGRKHEFEDVYDLDKIMSRLGIDKDGIEDDLKTSVVSFKKMLPERRPDKYTFTKGIFSVDNVIVCERVMRDLGYVGDNSTSELKIYSKKILV